MIGRNTNGPMTGGEAYDTTACSSSQVIFDLDTEKVEMVEIIPLIWTFFFLSKVYSSC